MAICTNGKEIRQKEGTVELYEERQAVSKGSNGSFGCEKRWSGPITWLTAVGATTVGLRPGRYPWMGVLPTDPPQKLSLDVEYSDLCTWPSHRQVRVRSVAHHEDISCCLPPWLAFVGIANDYSLAARSFISGRKRGRGSWERVCSFDTSMVLQIHDSLYQN